MQVIKFAKEEGRKLYRNLKADMGLLSTAETFPRMTGRQRVRAEMELTAAILFAAFGPTSMSFDKSVVEQFLDEYDYNPRITRVVRSSEPVVVVVTDDDGVRRAIRFGYAVGTTSVYPLTQAGFDEFMATRIGIASLLPPRKVPEGASEAPPPGVVPIGDCDGPQRYLHIGGVVDVRWLDNREKVIREHSPTLVMQELREHLAEFLPPLGRRADELTWYAKDGGPLPILCASSREERPTARMMVKAGFLVKGEQHDGSLKYELDLESVNAEPYGSQRRQDIEKSLIRLAALVDQRPPPGTRGD